MRASGRALAVETLKLATLPALRWTGTLTALVGGLMWMSMRQTHKGAFGFADIAWTWTSAVQVGFPVLCLLVGTSEHVCAQGRTTLLVLPRRTPVWVARLAVVATTALAGGAVLVGAVVAACPRGWSGASWDSGGDARVAAVVLAWFVAASLLGAGLGELLRSVGGAGATALMLVVVVQALGRFLGEWVEWLPGPAAQAWILGTGTHDGPGHPGLVVLAWTGAAMVAGGVRLVCSDA